MITLDPRDILKVDRVSKADKEMEQDTGVKTLIIFFHVMVINRDIKGYI